MTPDVLTYAPEQLLTFDQIGISKHPNHWSLFFGAKQVLASAAKHNHHLRGYALKSENILVKYSGWLSLLSKFYYPLLYSTKQPAISSKLPQLRYFSGLRSYVTAVKAMNQHRSQLVWFRWLYLLTSRYMWLNDWIEIKAEL